MSPKAMKLFLFKILRGVPHHFKEFSIFPMQNGGRFTSFDLKSGRLTVS